MKATRTHTNYLFRAASWILAVVMILSLLSVPQALAVTGSTVAADGTYTSSGKVSFSKDNYTFDVTLTVSEGKITNVTSTLTSTPEESKSKSKYHPNAVAAILKNLQGKDATKDNIDGVSSGTPKYSYAALKTALSTAISNAPAAAAAQTYTVTWKSQDGNTTLETDSNVTSGTKPSYDGATPTKENTSTMIYNFAGWATSKNQTSGTAAKNLPAVTANVTYYAAFSETAVEQGSYTITWNNWDDTELLVDSVKSGEIPQYTGATPTREGYVFTGWSPTVTAATKNQTYTAQFAEQQGVSPRTITIADGTYVNSSADVTTRDYTYNPVTTIVVSGGKITSISSEMLSDNAINQLRHKRATTEVANALSNQSVTDVNAFLTKLDNLNPDSDSSDSLADAVSGATLSTYALLNEIKAALCGTLVNPGATAHTPQNPTAVTSNGITMEKVLSYNGNGTYNLTLTAYAAEGAGTEIPGGMTVASTTSTEMWLIEDGQYTYAALANNAHYYYDGEYAYLLQGSGSNPYYIYYEDKNGDIKYLGENGTSGTSNSKTVSRTTQNILTSKFTSNSTIYTSTQPTSSGGTAQDEYTLQTGKISGSTLADGTYYYCPNYPNGNFYPLQGTKDGDKYYIDAYDASASEKKYNGLTEKDGWKSWNKNKNKGDKKKEFTVTNYKIYKKTTTTTNPVVPDGNWLDVPTLEQTGGGYAPGGKTTLGAEAELRDYINYISWDASKATVNATSRTTTSVNGVVTVNNAAGTSSGMHVDTSLLQEDGTISVTGFDYAATAADYNGSGEALVVTVANLKPTRAGDYVASNMLDVYGQNAGVYDANGPVVDIVSPLVKVLNTDVDIIYSEDATVSNTDFYGTVTIEPGVTVKFTGCEFYGHVYNEGTANFAKNDHFYAGMTTTGTSTVTQGEVYEYGTGCYAYAYGDNNYFFNSLLNDDKGVTVLTNVDYYATETECYTVSSNALADAQSGVAYSQDFNAVSYDNAGRDVFISAEPKNLVPDGISAATNRAGSSLTVEGTPNTVGDGLSFTLKLGSEDDNDTVIYYIPLNINIKDRAADPVDDTNNNEIRHVEVENTTGKDNGLYLNKTLTEREDGLYDLTLEAYTTGAVFSESYTAPADIVLVLDQSTSMTSNKLGDITRLQALKNAANDFISKIQQNAAQTGMDHRIAVVGFSADYSSTKKNYPGTEILSTSSEVNYEDATKEDYAGALVDVNVNNAVNSRLTTAITRVEAVAQTYDNFGMTMAKNILNNRSVTTFQKDGKTMDRRTVVIFFTDGCPGKPAGTFFWEGYDSISVANETILRAAELKNTGTAIYSVGVFEGAGSTAATDFSRSSYTSSTYGTHDQLVPAENAANAFMHYISSDYPNARSMEQPGIAAPEMYDVEGNYTGYYYTASNLDALYESFNDISVEVTRPILELKNTAVLFDELSDKFETTKDTVLTATAHAAYGYENGAYQFYNQASQTLDASLDGKIVKVTGFDYDSNFLYKDGNGIYHGQKVVVKIPALLPKTSGKEQDSNTGRSGIYADQSDIDAKRPAVGYFPKPNTDIPYYTRMLDIGAKEVVVATNVARLKGADENGVYQGQYGTFTLKDGKVTYSLNRNLRDSTKTIDLTVGVDTAFVYGAHSNTTTDTNNAWDYRVAEPKWQQITVVPGTDVYFDDASTEVNKSFNTDGETDLRYSYTDDAANAASMGDGAEKIDTTEGSKILTFTFTGTGIDVYSTTDSESGYVQAALYDSDGNRLAIKTMKNYSVTERYNVPSIFFTGYDYGIYTLKINVLKNSNYKLDAIRVYNPVSENTEYNEASVVKSVQDLYTANGQQSAKYVTLRELILDSDKITELTNNSENNVIKASGIAFYIDQEADGQYEIKDESFLMDGPKNEIYLAPNQQIEFTINGTYQNVEVGISSPDAKTDENGDKTMEAGKVTVTNGSGTKDIDINTVVDTYYLITPNSDGNVVIKNTGSGTISLTKVKLSGTYTAPATQNAALDGTVLTADAAPLMVTSSLRSYARSFSALPVVEDTETGTSSNEGTESPGTNPAEDNQEVEPSDPATTGEEIQESAPSETQPSQGGELVTEPDETDTQPTPAVTPKPSSSKSIIKSLNTLVTKLLKSLSKWFR